MNKKEEGRRRTGVLGGTFDPIHTGHLMMAECARDQLKLDDVLFLPAGNPPHKPHRTGGASDEDRLAMVRLAIADNPYFLLDPEEMLRSEPSYTNETMVRLCRRYPDTDFFFLIGADSLMSFESWRRPDIICAHCSLAVAVRDGVERTEIQGKIRELNRKFGAEIYLLQSPRLQIASSELRAWRRENRSVRYLVPEAVYDYMERRGLYREEPEKLLQSGGENRNPDSEKSRYPDSM